jgi:hypothetical protein
MKINHNYVIYFRFDYKYSHTDPLIIDITNALKDCVTTTICGALQVHSKTSLLYLPLYKK